MKKTYSGLLGSFAIWIVFAQAQAATTSLDPYLVVTGNAPPIEVNFRYMPYPAAADYPNWHQTTGKLSTSFTYDPLRRSLVVYANSMMIEINGSGGVGSFNTASGEFYHIPDPGTSCNTPLIPLRGVSGAAFPIVRATVTTYTCSSIVAPPSPAVPSYSVSYNAPSIVTVADGNQIESVKISVSKNWTPWPDYAGTPWADYVFGYRIGLIQMAVMPIQMAVGPVTSSFYYIPELSALTLPPPAIEGSAVEYINTVDFPASPGGHFFYSSDAGEQQFVDSGQVGHFYRTGRSFNAGGYVPVCRFYGSQTPGPNSHFFSADQNECAGLKALQKSPVPTDVQQWNSEGNGFYAVATVTDANGKRSCLTGTVPVYRAYNNAYAKDGKRNAWDSNHRFSTNRADIDPLVNNWGWTDEGIAFCAPG